MKMQLAALGVLAVTTLFAEVRAEDSDGVTWLVEYDGKKLPDEAIWTRRGQPKTEIVGGALHIVDDSDQDEGCFRALWKADPTLEIVVETRVKMGGIVGVRGFGNVWPWRDGTPAGILVSNGKHQEGFVLSPARIQNFADRVHLMNTTKEFHTYRLVIHGNDMSVSVDGKQVIQGHNAFWKPADSPEPFVQFGSNCKAYTGDAHWQYVKLGVRNPATARPPSPLKITISEPWTIEHPQKVRMSRPYLYDVGRGMLLLSVAQGPDAYFEPYGILKSTDEGKTWQSIPELTLKTFAPQPMIRLPGGDILGVSRWSVLYRDGVYVGMSFRFDPQAERFTMFENRIEMPKDTTLPRIVFDRHIFTQPEGSLLAVVYGSRTSHLLRSTDEGQTWKYFAPICNGGEPGVARFSDMELTTVFRHGTLMPLGQTFSHDGGKTWSAPITLEVGSVDPDVVVMSNGVLACSYGRPCSCLMFSLDKGQTWIEHRVISDKVGYNYTSIREIRPGRLLFLHDAPPVQAIYVDVELQPKEQPPSKREEP